jgi:hypothetical protein
VAAQLIAERPYSGWGPGTFGASYVKLYMPIGILPNFAYPHSAILNWVLQYGAGGAVLALVSLIGYHPSSVWKQLPLHLRLAITGAIVPLTVDDFGYMPGVLFPLIWVVSGVAIYSINIASVSDNCGDSRLRILIPVSIVTVAYWITMQNSRELNAIKRYDTLLRERWKPFSGNIAYYIKDLRTGREMESRSHETFYAPNFALARMVSDLMTENADPEMRVPIVYVIESELNNKYALSNSKCFVRLRDLVGLLAQINDLKAMSVIAEYVNAKDFFETNGRSMDPVLVHGADTYPDHFYEGIPVFSSAQDAARLLENTFEGNSIWQGILNTALRVQNVSRRGSSFIVQRGDVHFMGGVGAGRCCFAVKFQGMSSSWIGCWILDSEVCGDGLKIQSAWNAVEETVWATYVFFSNGRTVLDRAAMDK